MVHSSFCELYRHEVTAYNSLTRSFHYDIISKMRFFFRSYDLTDPGRRAMVNKLWCQEVARQWFKKKEEPPHARVFSEAKCPQHAPTWYLFYRWFIFVAWTTIIVCSFFELGSYEPLLAYDKWPIYLTNWDLLLGLAQALVGGLVVTKRWRLQKLHDFDPSTLKMGLMENIYWFLYVVTTNVAIVVTVSYWFSVYNPAIHHLDPLNIMLHVCNSILMIVDFCITSIPFRLRNFWWCLIIVFFYVTFTVIYYSAGGLDKHGCHYIYKILDWKKPVPALLVCMGEVAFVCILHFIMCFLAKVKDRLYDKLNNSADKVIVEIEKETVARSIGVV